MLANITIKYNKTFVSGSMKGSTVAVTLSRNTAAAVQRMRSDAAEGRVFKDCTNSRNQFTISNVEEV